MTKDKLLRSISRRLEGEARLPHEASSLGYDVYLLLRCYDLGPDQANEVIAAFKRKLGDWQFEDLALRQAHYAERLASSEGELLYEEMHKLFSLRDEIQALEELGMTLDEAEKEKLDRALAKRTKKERKKASLVAEDKAAWWKQDWWWYKR